MFVFPSEEKRLDILINNAGINFSPYIETVDGFESTFGINHFGELNIILIIIVYII